MHVIDAEGEILGRLASRVAVLLRGKHKPSFEMHLDEDGRKILSAIGIDRFVEPDARRYNTIREYSKILEAIQ